MVHDWTAKRGMRADINNGDNIMLIKNYYLWSVQNLSLSCYDIALIC